MTQQRTRLALAGLLAMALGVFGAGVANAADGDASLSSLSRAPDGTVNGVLTVQPFGNAPAVVDTGSLVMSVDGQDFPAKAQSASSVERSTILLIDRSGSMRDSGMATVRASVTQFLQSVPPDVKVGVVSFADKPNLDVAPTTDHGAVQAAVDGLKSSGDTALYDGLNLAIDTLGAAGDRSILILSDGKDTISSMKAPQAEQKLKASGIQTQVIAFKTSYTDNLALGYLAAAGQGGSVTAVENSAGVANAFSSAAKALNSQVSWSAQAPGVTGNKDVQLHGTANGKPFTATATVAFGEAPATPTPSASATTAPAPGSSAGGPPAGGSSGPARHLADGHPVRAHVPRAAAAGRHRRPPALPRAASARLRTHVSRVQVEAPGAGGVDRAVRHADRAPGRGDRAHDERQRDRRTAGPSG